MSIIKKVLAGAAVAGAGVTMAAVSLLGGASQAGAPATPKDAAPAAGESSSTHAVHTDDFNQTPATPNHELVPPEGSYTTLFCRNGTVEWSDLGTSTPLSSHDRSVESLAGTMSNGAHDDVRGILQQAFPEHTVTRDIPDAFIWHLTANAVGDQTIGFEIKGSCLTFTNESSGIGVAYDVPQRPDGQLGWEDLQGAIERAAQQLQAAHDSAR